MKALYFGASWCGMCKVNKPKFIDKCNEIGIDYEIIDAEKEDYLVDKYKVRNIPYVVLLDDQEDVQLSGMASDIIPIM